MKDTLALVRAYNNISLVYKAKREPRNSIRFLKAALRLKTILKDETGLDILYNNMGEENEQLNLLDSAVYFAHIALDYAHRFNNYKQIAGASGNLCIYYYKLGKYQAAYNYGIKGIEASKKLSDRLIRQDCILQVARALEKLNRKDEAIAHFKKYVELKDSVFNEEAQLTEFKSALKQEFDQMIVADSLKNAGEKERLVLENEARLSRQRIYTYAALGAFVLIMVIAFVSFRAYRQKKKDHHIIAEQKKLVEEKQTEIVDSINYAKRIQYTLLAHDELLKENLPEYFIFFRPKDIVSGDFYWATSAKAPVPNGQNHFYLAVCDSTGHGVPGAFMSLLNISFLNEAINEKNMTDPAKVFDHVRQKLIENISQEGQKDGMDGILIKMENGNQQALTYAAANNSPVLIRNKEVMELPCDKMPVGKGESDAGFKSQTFQVQKGDLLYLYTDGYADQFGGPRGKKFKYAQLNQLLAEISGLPMKEQHIILQQRFGEWQGQLEQLDDVCIIGIRI
jgi:serine phosphatase RsbU (regulator of sigma subunit)